MKNNSLLLILALMIGLFGSLGARAQSDQPANAVFVPLINPHELRLINLRDEGKWFECRPEKNIRLNDVRSMILPKPDLTEQIWPANAVLEIALVIQLRSLDVSSGEEGDTVATPLPITVSSLSDAEWQTGTKHRLPEEYFSNHRDNSLATVILDMEVTKAGSQMRLTWTANPQQLNEQIAHGLLVYLDTREQQPGVNNIRSVILGAMPDGSLAHLEIGLIPPGISSTKK